MLNEGPFSLDKCQYQLFLPSISLKILDLRWESNRRLDTTVSSGVSLRHTHTPTLDQILLDRLLKNV